jgi:DNA-binding phage protein
MPLTKAFKETIMVDLQDREFRAAYLADAIETMHGGEFSIAKRMLRNYINATIGFEALSKAVGSPAKSLMRMLGETSNPHADKLFGILKHLQETDRFEVRVVPRGHRETRRGSQRPSAKS